MPKELKKVYDDLKQEADGSVEIPNPLFAYKFQKGVKEEFKVSEESSLEDSRLQLFPLDSHANSGASHRFMTCKQQLAITQSVS
jgi:hypothetical protein